LAFQPDEEQEMARKRVDVDMENPPEAVIDFVCQALETERGGVLVYETAIRCAENEELAEEWRKYLEETREHVARYTEIAETLGIDPATETPGVQIARLNGRSLVDLMEHALEAGDPEAAQLVAAECVVIAETKCQLNWQLVGELGTKGKGPKAKELTQAYEEVMEQENEHLFHTRGWARELWIERLGMPGVLPPPEEEKDVKTAIGAERAKNAREEML
jgi:hypothetical protein